MANQQFSKNDIEQYLKIGKPIIIKDFKVPKENEDYYVYILEEILKYIGKEKVADHLGYCLRELIGNAKKANTKRVFFLEQNLDIMNLDHYNTGMKEFKTITVENIDHYLDLQQKYNLYVQIYFHIKDPYFNIIISNNSPLVNQEKEKITQKMARAKTYNSIDEAVSSVLDDSEGAGLGIVILLLILRKIGINDKNFAVAVDNNVTHMRIAMPLTLVTEEETEIISDALINEINSIPQFPENILALQNMLMEKEVDFASVINLIKTDPSLTMDLLKMANSAHYRRLNKIEKIDLAVTILGINGLKYLIQSLGAKKALEKKYSNEDLELLWAHSTQIAQIASILCDRFKLNDLGDYAYIGGLLHDIGKIVMRGLHSKTIDKITKICLEKGISVNIIENLMDGSNHALIGAKMAEKWDLPQKIINIIKYHDNPLAAPDDVREVVKIIYLAHLIHQKIYPGHNTLIDLDDLILDTLSIKSETEFSQYVDYVKVKLNSKI